MKKTILISGKELDNAKDFGIMLEQSFKFTKRFLGCCILLFLILLSINFVYASAPDSNWVKCKDLNITNQNSINMGNQSIIYNITGIKIVSDAVTEVRVADANCNKGGNFINITGTNTDNATWAQVHFITPQSHPIGTALTYSVYYNTSAPALPNFDSGLTLYDEFDGSTLSGHKPDYTKCGTTWAITTGGDSLSGGELVMDNPDKPSRIMVSGCANNNTFNALLSVNRWLSPAAGWGHIGFTNAASGTARDTFAFIEADAILNLQLNAVNSNTVPWNTVKYIGISLRLKPTKVASVKATNASNVVYSNEMTAATTGYQTTYYITTYAASVAPNGGRVDRIVLINGSEAERATMYYPQSTITLGAEQQIGGADTTPPVISDIWCTSCVPPDNTEPYGPTTDTTPTVNATTDENADCGISDTNSSFTACSTTGTTAHICTLPDGDALNTGTDYVYVNCTDATGNSAYEELQFTISDGINPIYSGFAINNSNPYVNDIIKYQANFTDNVNLSGCLYSLNDTGSWRNTTFTAINSNITVFNYSLTINTTYAHKSFNAYAWCNDTANNKNQTNSLTVNVSNSVPTHTVPILNSSSGTNYTNESLYGYNQSGFDADGDNIVFNYNWYKNDVLNASRWIDDDSLVLYLPFDGNTTQDYALDNDGIATGTLTHLSNGKVNGAFNFKNPDIINVSYSNSINFGYINDSFSVLFWVWTDFIDSSQRNIIQLSDSSNRRPFYCHKVVDSGTNSVRCKSYNGTSAPSVATPINLNEWAHITFIKNSSTNLLLYRNGVLNRTASYTITNDINITSPLRIGGDNFNGSIDEVMIFNRSLSTSEINQIYLATKDGFAVMNSSQTSASDNWTIEMTPYDEEGFGTPLNSTTLTILNYPPTFDEVGFDTKISHSLNLTIDVNCSDIDLDALTYYINNSALVTINSTTGIITDNPAQSDAGNYKLNVTCGDGTENISNQFWYNVTNSAPTINTSQYFGSTPSDGGYGKTNITVTGGCTDIDGDAIYYYFYLDSSSPPYVLKQSNTSNSYNTNLTSDNTYYYRYACGDLELTSGFSTIRSYILDTTLPNITLISQNNSNFSSKTVILYYNVTDASNISNCSLYINNSLSSTSTSIIKDINQNFSVDLNDGTYNWKVGCYDLVNNADNSSTYVFSVSYKAPDTGAVGSLYVGQGECKINVTPDKLIFNKANERATLKLKNDAVLDEYTKIILPEVPTLFGLQNYLEYSKEMFYLYHNSNDTVDILLTSMNGISEMTEVNMTVETRNCLLNIPIIILNEKSLFDVSVATESLIYTKGDVVDITVNIINKGNALEKDTNLIISVIEPDGKKYQIAEEKIKEIDSSMNLKKHYEYFISEEKSYGGYDVEVKFETERQGILSASKAFYVSPFNVDIMYVIGIGIIMFIIIVFVFINKLNSKLYNKIT